MSITHGYQTLTLLSQDPERKDFPVIALTANATQGEKQRVLNLGANSYLAKPFNPTKLYSKISALVSTACAWSLPGK